MAVVQYYDNGYGYIVKINNDIALIGEKRFKLLKEQVECVKTVNLRNEYIKLHFEKIEIKTINTGLGTYTGYAYGNTPHGKGKHVDYTGIVYEGDFVDGKQTGKCICKYINGYTYEGEVLNNLKHGQGKLYKENYICEGKWNNNLFTGFGIYKYPNGTVFEGKFENSVIIDGINKDVNGDVFEGTFVFIQNNNYTGLCKGNSNDTIQSNQTNTYYKKGKMVYKNGDVYEGEFADNKLNDYGKMIYANGDVYNGHWKNGIKHGQGELINIEGLTYNCYWNNGKKNGRGFIIYPNGDKTEFDWKDDTASRIK